MESLYFLGGVPIQYFGLDPSLVCVIIRVLNTECFSKVLSDLSNAVN